MSILKIDDFQFRVTRADLGGQEGHQLTITAVVNGHRWGNRKALVDHGPGVTESELDWLIQRATVELKRAIAGDGS